MLIHGWPPAARDVPTAATWRWRLPAAGAVFAGLAAAVLGMFRSGSLDLVAVVPETYVPLEWAEVGGWVLIGVLSLWSCVTHPRRRGVLLGAWLGVAAALAALREMDLHVLLNPGNIHYLGLNADQAVRFRLDWWTDGSVSAALKAGWAAALGTVGAAAILPFALAQYPWPRRLLNFDRWAVLTASGFGGLATAYVGDDLLANGSMPELAEELIEVVGIAMLIGSASLLAFRRVPLHGVSARA